MLGGVGEHVAEEVGKGGALDGVERSGERCQLHHELIKYLERVRPRDLVGELESRAESVDNGGQRILLALLNLLLRHARCQNALHGVGNSISDLLSVVLEHRDEE